MAKTHLADLHLEEMIHEPGAVIDTSPDFPPERAGNAPNDPMFERPDFSPGTPQRVAQAGRRISPLVTGRKSMGRGLLEVQQDRSAAGFPPPTAAVRELPKAAVRPAPAPVTRMTPLPQPPPGKKELGALVVQLGRFGDIINILPLLAEEARLLKRPIKVMVAREFASVLEGVSYVTPVIFEGDYGDLDKALAEAKRIDPAARCSQVYAKGKVFPRLEESFARDSWRRLGASHRWEQVPLYFDRRDRAREERLKEGRFERPTVLVNLGAQSYPFPHAERVMAALKAHAEKLGYDLLDLSRIKAERIYDLLGLMDDAACLITVDTATQHLACASSVPVIAFRLDKPWFASPRRANHILNRKYTDIDMREVTRMIEKVLKPVQARTLIIAPSRTDRIPDEMARIAAAQQTHFGEMIPIFEAELERNSKDHLKVLDDVKTSFMVDIFEAGLKQLEKPDDILIFINSDIGFSDTAEKHIRQLCKLKGACYGYRFDHPVTLEFPDHFSVVNASCNGGLDVFAFTRRWLLAHASEFPDMLLGRHGWDLVYRNVVKRGGGAELYGAIWHLDHESWWKINFDTPGNRWNNQLLKDYKTKNDVTRPFEP